MNKVNQQEYDYVGDSICIEEMPQGCVVADVNDLHEFAVVIYSKKDALALIKSLKKMLKFSKYK